MIQYISLYYLHVWDDLEAWEDAERSGTAEYIGYNDDARCFVNKIYNNKTYSKKHICTSSFCDEYTKGVVYNIDRDTHQRNIHYFKLTHSFINDIDYAYHTTIEIMVLYNDMDDEHERKKYILNNAVPLLSLLIKTEREL